MILFWHFCLLFSVERDIIMKVRNQANEINLCHKKYKVGLNLDLLTYLLHRCFCFVSRRIAINLD